MATTNSGVVRQIHVDSLYSFYAFHQGAFLLSNAIFRL
jgi:hypothetical protein